MGFVDWLLEPFNGYKLEEVPEESPRVSLPESPPAPLFRPKYFSEYIGQDKAKNILMSYIEGVRKRNMPFPHTLIYGNAGCGKTTLARIIANQLDIPFQEIIGSQIKDSYAVVWKLHDFGERRGIIFLDEVHALDRNTVEGLYPLMEDFTYEGKSITPFTLIGATTELGEIIKTRRPFADRFKLWLELEPYTMENMTTIVKQYKDAMYPTEFIPKEVYDTIGRNARCNPRMSIRLMDSTIYVNGDIKRVLNNFSIIEDGYTLKDIKCLKYIKENEKGVGLQGLCSFLNVPQEFYMYEIEPYLLQNNLIIRTPRGRKITQLGIDKIKKFSL